MKKVLNIFKIIFIIAVIILSFFFIKEITKLNVLPAKYFNILLIMTIILNLLGAICLLVKKVWPKILSCIFYVIIIVTSLVGINYVSKTNNFLDKAFNNNTMEITTYNVLALKSKNYKNIEDIKDKTLGYLSSDASGDESLNKVKEKVVTDNKSFDDLYDLYDAFIGEEVDTILLDTSYIDILVDEYSSINDSNETVSFADVYQVIYSFDIKTEKKVETTTITKLEPFNIYISGSDSRSTVIYNKSRSDVNMVMTVNPDTKSILMTTIPRDYYVQVHGQTGLKDKLTHSGIYGVDISRQTVEDLFDIDIAYSIKVGFPSVVKLVDLVGGIDIESDRAFNSYHMKGWRVEKGINHMDGAKALAYARERYAYKTGDRHRILNQQQVLEAVLKKIITNKSLLTKYDELLNSLSDLYRTDMPKEVITLLVKRQLEDMSSWHFESQTVSGSDASSPTYTAPNSKRYVMVPYEEDVTRAHNKITEVLNKTKE